MLQSFPNNEFLENLRNCCSHHALNSADITGRGNEGVIVMTPESVIKIYGSTESKRGISSFSREQNALLALGGNDHEHFEVPVLKSSHVFKESFNLLGVSYGAMIEQTRLRGEQPTLESIGEQTKLGQALGEFHKFLHSKSQGELVGFSDLLEHRVNLLTQKTVQKSLLKPGSRKQLIEDLLNDSAISTHRQAVHGDFRPGNFLWDVTTDKVGILDLTTIGHSMPEQDLAHLVNLSKDKLKNIFNGYKDVTGYKPKLATAQKLHLLDVAIAMNCAHESGNDRGAETLRKRFNTVWKLAYGETRSGEPTYAPKNPAL